jgi:elongation factor 2
MVKKELVESIARVQQDPRLVRNIAIIAHVDHGKTTLTDSILAAGGMLSASKAGHECATMVCCVLCVRR